MTKQKSIDELNDQWVGMQQPRKGQIFKHYKGGEYEIIATGFLEDTEATCVVYRSLEKDIVWVRTAKNFFEQVEHNGAKQPRFELG